MTTETPDVADGQWQGNFRPLAGWWVTLLTAVVFAGVGVLLRECLPAFAVTAGISWGIVVGYVVFTLTCCKLDDYPPTSTPAAALVAFFGSILVIQCIGLWGILFAACAVASAVVCLVAWRIIYSLMFEG